METSQVLLNQGLTFLACTTGFIILIVGFFLIRLLSDLSNLTRNVDKTTVMINTELEPTLKDLNETVKIINSLVKSTDKRIDKVRATMENLLGIGTSALSKAKTFSDSLASGAFKGFFTMLKLFSKK